MPLEDLQKYVAGITPVTAKDMNTLGKVVEMVRGIAGDDFYVDASGVVRRKRPTLIDTLLVRLTAFSTPAYDWTEVDVNKSDGSISTTTNGLTSDDAGQAFDPTGANDFTADSSTGSVVTIKKKTDPSTGDQIWEIVSGGGGGIDVEQAGTVVVASTPYINIPANRGTSGIFEMVTSTVAGRNGADLQLKSGGTNGASIYWSSSSGTWNIDLWRFT